ncbi:hypothetical protein GDO81_010457 [Engystomops pustulosus]|uniref:Uncharacterized protein n=1 Tax=Engystomops pustulosus TaxID=76066 RepID=A0AAV7C039_ENGPU|nr:hypothetical protein GDO81_010457 [Engystomops pustulosus]
MSDLLMSPAVTTLYMSRKRSCHPQFNLCIYPTQCTLHNMKRKNTTPQKKKKNPFIVPNIGTFNKTSSYVVSVLRSSTQIL